MKVPRLLGVDSYFQVDAALRYHRVLGAMELGWDERADVLEVGSGSGGITSYLDHNVTGVDPAFDRTVELSNSRLTAVPGTADKIPFGDESFDFVVSVEMMEHLPPDVRGSSLEEMWRVLRPGGRLVLTFPAGAAARALDLWLNDEHLEKFGVEHPWVSEHIREGIPEVSEITEPLEKLGAEVSHSGHLGEDAFRRLHALYTLGWGGPVFGRILRTKWVARVVFRRLERDAGSEPAYRAIVVADKSRRVPQMVS